MEKVTKMGRKRFSTEKRCARNYCVDQSTHEIIKKLAKTHGSNSLAVDFLAANYAQANGIAENE
jgi:hypothetical protein